MKKFLSVIIALILPITLLCGCSAKRLTADEYKTEMQTAVSDWLKTVADWSAYCAKNIMVETSDNSYDMEFQKMQEHKPEMEKKLDAVEDSLNKIDKVGRPPAEYDDLHKQIKNGVSIEQKWLKYQREMVSAKSAEKFKAAGDKVEELVNETADESLPNVYFEMVKQWNADSGEDWNTW